jgi:hypothetical protein
LAAHGRWAVPRAAGGLTASDWLRALGMLIIRILNILSLLLFNSTSWLGVLDALGRASSHRILSSGLSLRLSLSLRHRDDVIEERSKEIDCFPLSLEILRLMI